MGVLIVGRGLKRPRFPSGFGGVIYDLKVGFEPDLSDAAN